MRVGRELSEESDLAAAINAAWVLLCTALVFWEQAGFAMWEAGCLRSKSVHSILLKNMCDAAIGAAAFFSLGYAIGFGGGPGDRFAGNDHFFLRGVPIEDYHVVFFQWAFAATAATTVSGCMAERTRFAGYLIYSFFITALIYAVPLHWLWADAGWLCAWGENAVFGKGMIDFAGSGIVHMLGGVAGLVGSYLVGPRKGRFTDKGAVQIEGHSIALTTLGVYCLWFGWYGFNAGYTLGTTGGMWKTAALICVNTTISPSAAILSVLLFEKLATGCYDSSKCMNGVVAGLVGITGPCGVVEPWAAAVIGVVSGAVYCGGWRLHERLRIDDPVHAGAVHAWPGLWGCVASGLFAWPDQVAELGYVGEAGLFYTGSAGQLGANLLGTFAVLAWTIGTSSIVFGSLKAAKLLRVTPEEEEMGVDLAEHLPREGVEPLLAKLRLPQEATRAEDVAAAACGRIFGCVRTAPLSK